MAILIWGRRQKAIDGGPAGTELCATCGQSRPFRWKLHYQLNHLYYVFGFVSGKQYLRACEVCGRGAVHPAAEVEASLGKSAIPFMDRFGCLAALGGVASLILFAVLLRLLGPEPRNVPDLLARATRGEAASVARLRAEAESGDAPSQDALVELYTGETGASPNWNEAFRFARLAAERGSARAQHELGSMYELGRGTKADPSEALAWYRKAEAQGLAVSANSIGVFYLQGVVVAANSDEAARYFRKAADAGDVAGCYNLAGRYATGSGAAQDFVEARRWLERAVATKDERPNTQAIVALARFSLGQIYEEGAGVEKDLVKALRYYEEASPLNEKARASFERLKARLSKG